MLNPKLVFYAGVMYAGKTTSMLMFNESLKQVGFKTLIIKPIIDTRDCNSSHNEFNKCKSRLLNSTQEALYVSHIDKNEIIKNYDFDILLVDELQFFSTKDVEELSDIVDLFNKPVYCYGLKVNASGNLFNSSAKLLSIADEVHILTTTCECGANAVMNIRYINGEIDSSIKDNVIENKNIKYKSVCRKCWKKLNKIF